MPEYESDSSISSSDRQPPLARPTASPIVDQTALEPEADVGDVRSPGPLHIREADIGPNKLPISFTLPPAYTPLAISAPHTFMHGLLANGDIYGPFLADTSETILPRIVPDDSDQLNGARVYPAGRGDPHVKGLRKLYFDSSSSHGRVWDAFKGRLQIYQTKNIFVEEAVVVKSTDPHRFPKKDPPVGSFTSDEARKAIIQESNFYSRHLLHLQGLAVPNSYGLWGGRLKLDDEDEEEETFCEIWVMILEDCGPEVDVATLTDDEKREIVYLYRELHKSGVIHGDPNPRHWRRHPAGGFRLIDFDSAFLLEAKGRLERSLMEDELDLVKSWLIEEDQVWYV